VYVKIKNVSLRIQNYYLVIWPDVNCRSETYLEVAMWRVEVFICSGERLMATCRVFHSDANSQSITL
jgi:hypothetical protein